MSTPTSAWPHPLRLVDVARGTVTRHLVADEPARAAIAKELDLVALNALEADLTSERWFDGVQIDGRWQAEVVQTCGVTLEDFATPLEGDFRVRVVLSGSPHAPTPEAEVVIDLEADDPPDVSDSDTLDLGAYVIEHLALEIDPFPRKPGAEFQAPEQPPERSPFAVLRGLKSDD